MTQAGSAISVQIMGPLRLWSDGIELDPGPRQQRCLLALLLAREGSPISMTDLVELIWGPDSPPSAVNVIHGAKVLAEAKSMAAPRARTPGTARPGPPA